MAKKKLPFIRLSFVFILIVVEALFMSWGYHKEKENDTGMSMMNKSMGGMMGENHLKEITIRDLLVREELNETSQNEDTSAGHHDSEGSFVGILHRLTTISIVILVPLIIAGSIFLMIIWFDRP